MQGKKNKILLWTIPFLMAGIVAAFLFIKPPAQTLVLSDGTKVTLAGVTYGQHHRFPGKTPVGYGQGMNLDTTNDTLCVWLRQVHGKDRRGSAQVLAFDSAETACVGTWARRMQRGDQPNEELSGVSFTAFPRRDRKIKLHFQEWNPKGGYELSQDSFVIANPAPRQSYTEWSPETLPINQTDGDLEVTLTRLKSGVPFNTYRKQDKNDPSGLGVLAAFRLKQNGQSATNWQPVKIITSDATGNSVANSGWSNRRENGEAVLVYQWGLWPDEPAWKLRVEFSRTSGFAEAECWTVKDIPVEKGDPRNRYRRDNATPAFAETTIDGIRVKLFSVQQYDQNRSSGMGTEFKVQLDPPPDDRRLTIIKITDDQNQEIQKNNGSWGTGNYRYSLRNLGDAKTINVTMALHRSRFAEFTAKPGKD